MGTAGTVILVIVKKKSPGWFNVVADGGGWRGRKGKAVREGERNWEIFVPDKVM